MLMNLLRENLERFLPSCSGQESSVQQGYSKPDSWRKELGLDLTSSTESCSATTLGSQESSVHQWQTLVVDKDCPTRFVAHADPTAEDTEDELPVLSTKRSRKLPGTWYYSSNHIMINTERTKKNIHPLTRKDFLDKAARWHAESMAKKDNIFHANPAELKLKVGRPCRVIGANVLRGESIRAIHNKMMDSPADVSNMMDARYVQFGMATARSTRGDLLLVQLFMG